VSYNWNNKIRGHRRDGTFQAPDIASLVQTNPAFSSQVKYTGIKNKTVFESSFSVMSGQTNYLYQPDTLATAVRMEDATLNTSAFAAQRHEEQPNSRYQFDNIVSQNIPGMGGDHLLKAGVQFGRLSYEATTTCRTISTCSTATACRRRCASGTRRRSRRTSTR